MIVWKQGQIISQKWNRFVKNYCHVTHAIEFPLEHWSITNPNYDFIMNATPVITTKIKQPNELQSDWLLTERTMKQRLNWIFLTSHMQRIAWWHSNSCDLWIVHSRAIKVQCQMQQGCSNCIAGRFWLQIIFWTSVEILICNRRGLRVLCELANKRFESSSVNKKQKLW